MNINNLTLEEKVGQMLCFAFHGTEFNEQLKEQIERLKIGGVIHFARNITNIKQVSVLNEKIQKHANIPMFICLDQEGGSVLRVMDGITPLPGAMSLAASNADVYDICNRVGKDLKCLGFNVNFAPVGDVNNNPSNPVINSRSYSDDANMVAKLAVDAFKGFQEAKLLPTIKHFPGHGNTSVDSHLGLPIVKDSKECIKKTELVPFVKAINEGIDGVMISHILFEAYDKEYPSSLSYNIITKLLKEELGFKGLIVTDSLTMGAIYSKYSIEEIVLHGVNAGNDMLCFCGKADLDEQNHIVDAFIQLVKDGKISMERLNESVSKILKYKEKYCVKELDISNIETKVGKKDDVDMALKMSQNSITLVKDNNILPLTNQDKILLVFPEIKLFSLVDNENQKYKTLKEYINAEEIIINEKLDNLQQVKQECAKYDKIIFATYNIRKDDYQTKVYDVLDKNKTIVISLRSPYDINYLYDVKTYICIYEATPLSLNSVAKCLYDKSSFKGKLSIKL